MTTATRAAEAARIARALDRDPAPGWHTAVREGGTWRRLMRPVVLVLDCGHEHRGAMPADTLPTPGALSPCWSSCDQAGRIARRLVRVEAPEPPAEYVHRIRPENRPSPAHASAYAACKAADRRAEAAAADVERLRAELADAVDVLAARRRSAAAAWEAEQRAAFGE